LGDDLVDKARSRVGEEALVTERAEGARRIRIAALLLIAGMAAGPVGSHVGLWQQLLVPDRVIRFFAWAPASVFLLETAAAFTRGRGPEWWLYGPVSLVLGLLALVVARRGGAGPRRFHRPHRTLPTH
jgi:hypothetical protein